MQQGLKFAVVATGFALLVGVLGAAVVAPEARRAIWAGAGVGLAIQLATFATLFLWAFARQPLLAHGLGILVRMSAVGVIALLWVPPAELPAGPLLFSVVSVFFVTTLVEPFFVTSLRTARS